MTLKFRTWDKVKNDVVSVVAIDFEKERIYTGWNYRGNREYIPFDESELMQYTGLKDRDGVEIYEGDILEWEGTATRRKDWVGLVERKNSEFIVWTSNRAYSSGGWLNVATEAVKVIGNMHEHYYLIPEILEENIK